MCLWVLPLQGQIFSFDLFVAAAAVAEVYLPFEPATDDSLHPFVCIQPSIAYREPKLGLYNWRPKCLLCLLPHPRPELLRVGHCAEPKFYLVGLTLSSWALHSTSTSPVVVLCYADFVFFGR